MLGKKTRGEPEVRLDVVLGSNCCLEGELHLEGRARLDGRFTGRILGSGQVIVGPDARVQADIESRSVVIGGRVEGDVRASERVELQASAQLFGSINAPKVSIAEGAWVGGRFSMTEHPTYCNVTVLRSS